MAADGGAALVDARLLVRPRSYSGNSQEWNGFTFVFKSYVGVVAHPMLAAMIHAETLNEPIVISGPSSRGRTTLAESVVPAGTTLVWTSSATQDERGEDQNGPEAWRLLVRSEQPVSGANRTAADAVYPAVQVLTRF